MRMLMHRMTGAEAKIEQALRKIGVLERRIDPQEDHLIELATQLTKLPAGGYSN